MAVVFGRRGERRRPLARFMCSAGGPCRGSAGSASGRPEESVTRRTRKPTRWRSFSAAAASGGGLLRASCVRRAGPCRGSAGSASAQEGERDETNPQSLHDGGRLRPPRRAAAAPLARFMRFGGRSLSRLGGVGEWPPRGERDETNPQAYTMAVVFGRRGERRRPLARFMCSAGGPCRGSAGSASGRPEESVTRRTRKPTRWRSFSAAAASGGGLLRASCVRRAGPCRGSAGSASAQEGERDETNPQSLHDGGRLRPPRRAAAAPLARFMRFGGRSLSRLGGVGEWPPRGERDETNPQAYTMAVVFGRRGERRRPLARFMRSAGGPLSRLGGVGERPPRGERDETNPQAYTMAVVFGRRGERRRPLARFMCSAGGPCRGSAGSASGRPEESVTRRTRKPTRWRSFSAAAASGGGLLRTSCVRRAGPCRGSAGSASAQEGERDETNPQSLHDGGRLRPPRRAAAAPLARFMRFGGRSLSRLGGVGEWPPRGERDETNPQAYTMAVVFGRRGERRRPLARFMRSAGGPLSRLGGVGERPPRGERDETNPQAYTMAVVFGRRGERRRPLARFMCSAGGPCRGSAGSASGRPEESVTR